MNRKSPTTERQGVAKTIALFLETNGEYGRDFLKGVAQYAHERKTWQLKLVALVDAKDDRAFDGCDGIIARVAEPSTIERLKATGLPIVDSFCHLRDESLIGVDGDHAFVARMAAEYFMRRGFRHFAYCGYKGTRFSDEYSAAFGETLAKAGFKLVEFDVPEPPSDAIFFSDKPRMPKSPRRLESWLKRLPPMTALFCATDLRAYHAIKLCQKAGRKVPDDVAIMGVDDDMVLCACSTPSITSIDPNARSVGYAAARFLNAAMKNPGEKRKARPIHRVKPRGIVERESTAIYPMKPKWFAKALEHIDANVSRPLAASDLESVAGVSHTAINNAFHREFGMSAGEYILGIKMRKAKALVEEGKLMIKQIAAETGFTSPKYFCRAYHAYFGHPPSKGYRKPS